MPNEKLADETYKLSRCFMEWLDLSKAANPDMEEVSMAWKRLIGQEKLVRQLIETGEVQPCEDCPDD